MKRLLQKYSLPELLLYVFVFLLPLQTRWIFVESDIPFQQMGLYAFDLALIALIVSIFTGTKPSLFAQLRKAKFNFTHPRHVMTIAASILLLFALLGTAWSIHTDLTTYWAVRLFLGLSLFWLLPFIRYDFRNVTLALMSAITLQALLGVAQFFTQDVLLVTKWLGAAMHDASTLGTSVIETTQGRWLRAYGTQPHPNVFGGLMVLGIILTHHLLNTLEFGKHYGAFIAKRVLLIASHLVLVTGLLFSFSRAAWVALSVIVLLYVLSKFRHPGRPARFADLMLFPLASMALIMFLIHAPAFTTRFDTSARLEQRSVEERVTGLSHASVIISEHPATGDGYGTYTYELQRNNPELAWHNVHPVHNAYLLTLAELGAVGITLLFLMFVLALYAFRYHLYTGSLLLSLLILGMFDHYLWTLPSMFFILWLVFALHTRTVPNKTRS